MKSCLLGTFPLKELFTYVFKKMFLILYHSLEFFTTGIPLVSILPAYKCQIGKSMMICVIFLWRAKAGANTEI